MQPDCISPGVLINPNTTNLKTGGRKVTTNDKTGSLNHSFSKPICR